MIVITLSKVPQSLRGDLTKWCQEIQTGVYIGNFSARIRDLLWQRIIKNIGSNGEATMVFNTNNELGYTFRTIRSDKEVVDFDGVPLIRHLNNNTSTVKHGFSNAAKYHHIRMKNRITLPNDIDIVVLDIETTGLDPAKDKIISIGAVKRSNSEWKTFYKLVSSNVKIPDNICDLTGISSEDIREKGHSLASVFNELKSFVGNSRVVGYNFSFDMSFLLNVFNDLNIPNFINSPRDLMSIVKRHNQFLDNYRLSTVLKYYNIVNEHPHNSLSDAKAEYLLAEKLNKNGSFKI
ncbi:type I-E CRISPR-associated endoribonuclease Cas2e [Lactobacillus hamsteri]|uniref:DNA polymerase III polC-type n=1 Tax=Lactobacillus hamsteri DSM 5661 = JCM 6256 TaxID=1423754 RepID=A0A0R1Y6V4_9LACO|nr:type I-E CRISPR-associated endoribonuclease Cas2e [Lactobacillus hamsteri]KRM38167.1 hypothetical protein FC39_GL001407 [Lactobacillus hamsteri DSM 5661 = JCM 6256]